MTIEQRLKDAGITLPKPAAPAANYVPFVIHAGLLHVAGQIPFRPDGSLYTGTLGGGLGIEEGQEAARLCALGILAQANAALGSLDRVVQVVKLGVFVASTPDFTDQPRVANGASDLIAEIFKERGRHARSAVGVAALPLGVAVEVDAIIACREE